MGQPTIVDRGEHTPPAGSNYVALGTARLTVGRGVVARVRGTARATAGTGATVYASEASAVDASGDAMVFATGPSLVTATDTARVNASNRAVVHAHGRTTVYAEDLAYVSVGDDAACEARDDCHVIAYNNAAVIAHGRTVVRAHGSARVRAHDRTVVYADGSARVTASERCTVYVEGHAVRVFGDRSATVYPHRNTWVAPGGPMVRDAYPDGSRKTYDTIDPHEWCAVNGVDMTGGVATLFKCVDVDYRAGVRWGDTSYRPGTNVTAPDWRPDNKCGGGLHLAPDPTGAMWFAYSPPVVLLKVHTPIAGLRPIPGWPLKCKVETCFVVEEVDKFGRPMPAPGAGKDDE